MAKYPYFHALEDLAALALSAVRLSTRDATQKRGEDRPTLRHTCHRTLCDLEDALFADFLPPLERDDIAILAHALSHVVDTALSLSPPLSPRAETADSARCLRLAEQLSHDIGILKKIRKPSEMPALREFRALLAEEDHAKSSPRYAPLRLALSHAFDTLVEVMLNNI